MRRLAAIAVGLLVIIVLGVGQLVLPGIAASHLRSQLSRDGQVLSVSVSAFPAVKLLWHQADKVVIRMGRYDPPSGSLPATLAQTADASTVSASAQEFHYGLVTLHDASLAKQGNTLSGSALVNESDLRNALPILSSVTPVASSGGKLTFQGTAFGISADATVSVSDGNLTVVPDIPFGSLATITLFSDPHVAIEQIAASAASGQTFAVKGTATLR